MSAKVQTEGVRYTGSKREIIPKILEICANSCDGIRSVLDGCSGTTRVSQAFKTAGYDVTANDLAEYTQVFGRCYLLNNKPKQYFVQWVEHLNSIEGKSGWFTKHYGGVVGTNPKGNAIQSDGKKRPWQIHNTKKLDSILEEIPKLTADPTERSVLLTSTILAMDKVDNTMGHQVAFLKQWPKRSFDTIHLEVPRLISGQGNCSVSRKSIFDIEDYFDLVYLDPPYGTNNQVTKTTRVRYRSYYHLWTTICKNDQPSLHGAALRRYDASSDSLPGGISQFESTNHEVVYQATRKLIEQLNCRYVLFSYSITGKVTPTDLQEIFSQYKLLQFARFDYKEHAMKRCTSNETWLGDQGVNQEFLILIEKRDCS
jgi:adenine-specific DNA-methyltransferase